VVDDSLLLIDDEKWKSYGIPHRLVIALKSVSSILSIVSSHHLFFLKEAERQKKEKDSLLPEGTTGLKRTISSFTLDRRSIDALNKLVNSNSTEKVDVGELTEQIASLTTNTEKPEEVIIETATSNNNNTKENQAMDEQKSKEH
jgi:hypothetical protein